MPKSNSLTNDVDFLFEMGNIRFIHRMWHRYIGVNFANLAEHHFRVFWIAMIIAQHEKNVDIGKVARLTMIHDIAESRTGDVDYLARQYVKRNEELGIKDMLDGTSIEKEYYDLWQEYEERKTIEAKIAKDADNLDIDFELAEQTSKGNVLNKVWNNSRRFVYEEKLYTKTAKAIYRRIEKADPHAWHLKSRNRSNSGDWVAKKK